MSNTERPPFTDRSRHEAQYTPSAEDIEACRNYRHYQSICRLANGDLSGGRVHSGNPQVHGGTSAGRRSPTHTATSAFPRSCAPYCSTQQNNSATTNRSATRGICYVTGAMDSLISSPANPNLNSNHGPRASSIPQEVHLNPGLATEASRAYHGPHQHSYPGATQQLESWAQGSGVNTHARIDVHPLVRHLPIQTASEHARRPNANTLGAQARSNSGYTAVHASAGFYPGFTAVQASTPSHIFLPPSVPASRSARHRNETIAQAMAAPPAAFSAPISSAPRVVSASEYARRQPSPIQPSPMPYFLTPAPPYEALPSYDDVAPPMPPVSFTPVIEEDGHTTESGENEARPENGDGEANQEDEENQEEVEIGLLSPIAINVSALPQ